MSKQKPYLEAIPTGAINPFNYQGIDSSAVTFPDLDFSIQDFASSVKALIEPALGVCDFRSVIDYDHLVPGVVFTPPSLADSFNTPELSESMETSWKAVHLGN